MTTTPPDGDGTVPAPARDPWKGFRGVCAGTLVLEAIVVFLALPVVATVGGGLSWISGIYIVGLGVVMLLGAGLQGRPWALQFDVALQVLVIVGFLAHPSIAIVGLLFSCVWAYLIYLRRDLRKRIAEGRLPSQREQQGR
ncbi:DUF4233 domain-containing protein [Rhodococcoides corynebacterioides]|uniref:DUF4233 domain-containing protein n=1 Tax=Rhodococcoides corynebacterioides TaxID=53972 RepID=A0ABS7P7C8_9NOCA|nr:DUF4233 domain-containing protein [Rhodococcus corynebacterioides]MBY6368240.1 DUF4233 domain-containing protein [Rhodococcus corynebacterioides]MBY6409195.1 DUF4233 domain-containing protein [Rhodococcus corynebacterioides]